MKLIFKIIRIALLILIILCGSVAASYEFGGNHIGFLSKLAYIPLFFFISAGVAAYILEWGNYKKTKKLYEFSVTFIGLIFASIIVSKYIQRAIIERRITEMKFVSIANSFTKTSIEFKKGHDFKLIEAGSYEMTVYYGKYSSVNDTIKIISSNYDGPKKEIPMLGVIKNDTLFWIKADTMVLEK